MKNHADIEIFETVENTCFMFCNNWLAVQVPVAKQEQCRVSLEQNKPFRKVSFWSRTIPSYLYNSYFLQDLEIRINKKSGNISFCSRHNKCEGMFISQSSAQFFEWLTQNMKKRGFKEQRHKFKPLTFLKRVGIYIGCPLAAILLILLIWLVPELWILIVFAGILFIIPICVTIITHSEKGTITLIYKMNQERR